MEQLQTPIVDAIILAPRHDDTTELAPCTPRTPRTRRAPRADDRIAIFVDSPIDDWRPKAVYRDLKNASATCRAWRDPFQCQLCHQTSIGIRTWYRRLNPDDVERKNARWNLGLARHYPVLKVHVVYPASRHADHLLHNDVHLVGRSLRTLSVSSRELILDSPTLKRLKGAPKEPEWISLLVTAHSDRIPKLVRMDAESERFFINSSSFMEINPGLQHLIINGVDQHIVFDREPSNEVEAKTSACVIHGRVPFVLPSLETLKLSNMPLHMLAVFSRKMRLPDLRTLHLRVTEYDLGVSSPASNSESRRFSAESPLRSEPFNPFGLARPKPRRQVSSSAEARKTRI
ncbi:BQ2448_6087 [Microbotryum intermedium]|uniref:BQ2448_6087 protein n=1 Tax=Microbotryum intermedium TaxID=269621 RepID=A0A238FK78_9BASI|nr:BQ2448_6087 [Microbotryum intermedium]